MNVWSVHVLSLLQHHLPYFQLHDGEFAQIWSLLALLFCQLVSSIAVNPDLVTYAIHVWQALVLSIEWFHCQQLTWSKWWSPSLVAEDSAWGRLNFEWCLVGEVEEESSGVTYVCAWWWWCPLSASEPTNHHSRLHLKQWNRGLDTICFPMKILSHETVAWSSVL